MFKTIIYFSLISPASLRLLFEIPKEPYKHAMKKERKSDSVIYVESRMHLLATINLKRNRFPRNFHFYSLPQQSNVFMQIETHWAGYIFATENVDWKEGLQRYMSIQFITEREGGYEDATWYASFLPDTMGSIGQQISQRFPPRSKIYSLALCTAVDLSI